MRILYLENHPHFSRVVTKEFLSDHEVVVVPTIQEAKQTLSEQSYQIALVDYDLDDGKGVEFVRYIVERKIRIPVVACSSHERGNNEMMQAGAVAMCSKMEFKNIASVVKRAVM